MSFERNPDWNELLTQAKAGKPEARDVIFRELSVILGLVVQYRLMGWSHQDQADLVQDALLVLSQKLYQIKSNPHQYAYKILHHKIGDALRRRRRIKMPIRTDPMDDAHPKEINVLPTFDPESDRDGIMAEIQAQDLTELIKNAIKSLNPFCRTFFLGILDDRSNQELWAFFRKLEPGLRHNTYKKRVFDCRKKLKQLVRDQI
ncbi:MAG: sigma-70 family RNA polymerase sigma factor [bacterium]